MMRRLSDALRTEFICLDLVAESKEEALGQLIQRLSGAQSADEIAKLIDQFDRQHRQDVEVKRTEDGRVIHHYMVRAPGRGSRKTEASIFIGEGHEESRVYHPGA